MKLWLSPFIGIDSSNNSSATTLCQPLEWVAECWTIVQQLDKVSSALRKFSTEDADLQKNDKACRCCRQQLPDQLQRTGVSLQHFQHPPFTWTLRRSLPQCQTLPQAGSHKASVGLLFLPLEPQRGPPPWKSSLFSLGLSCAPSGGLPPSLSPLTFPLSRWHHAPHFQSRQTPCSHCPLPAALWAGVLSIQSSFLWKTNYRTCAGFPWSQRNTWLLKCGKIDVNKKEVRTICSSTKIITNIVDDPYTESCYPHPQFIFCINLWVFETSRKLEKHFYFANF